MNCQGIGGGLNILGPIVNGGLLVPHYELIAAATGSPVLNTVLVGQQFSDSVTIHSFCDDVNVGSSQDDEVISADSVDTIAIKTVKN